MPGPVRRKVRMGLEAGVLVERAFQQRLECMDFGIIPFLRGTDGLLAQVVAQHVAGIGF